MKKMLLTLTISDKILPRSSEAPLTLFRYVMTVEVSPSKVVMLALMLSGSISGMMEVNGETHAIDRETSRVPLKARLRMARRCI